MNINTYLKEYAQTVLGDGTHIAPNVPDKKLNGAIKTYAQDALPEHVVVLYDSTLFKSGKEGMLFLGDRFYFKPLLEKPICVLYKDLQRVDLDREVTYKNDKRKEKLHVVMHTEQYDYSMTDKLATYNVEGVVELLNGIAALKDKEDELVNVSQVTPLADLPETYKLTYLKILANFTFVDDQQIDAKEYSELMSLVTRIHLSSEYRLQLRSYLSNPSLHTSTTDLIEELRTLSTTLDFSIVEKSLFKDLLYLFKLKRPLSAWFENAFLQQLKEDLSISRDEIELISNAIQSDEDILTFRKNDSEIAKSMKDLAAKAAAVGVPLTAIYLSGSVVGLSAAGLTSGLASLGMGGLLGFSSMFTGIGVLVVIGVGTYQGLKKITGMKDIENNKQREYMLQAIIRNTQQTLNYLLEDINEISSRLVVAIQQGNENSEKINQLSNMLQMLSQSAQFSADKQTHSQKEQIMTQLPSKLSAVRLDELTSKATYQKIRDYVYTCYTPEPIQLDDMTFSNEEELVLKETLTLEELEQLHESFQAIGYFEMTGGGLAEVTGGAKRLVKNVFGDR
ncbi:hypothetical protein EVJ30_08300 [Exiguobacterium sp. SH5S13]|uniref:hypothetical protein n=1 Tax=Exiguobacterium sp. SH5S13 TaxID=2510959 RepID=UPI00103E2F3A|nr:hypothetical protein [Exiguobacterium sp. SH5S13]TCI53436.1 hypothetical protein EVJ30_08300 [Exiguobacterium sp. SH5S13]